MSHVHESPRVMTIPLGVLAAGALFAGFAGLGMIADDGAFWAGAIVTGPDNHVLHAMHEVPFLVKAAAVHRHGDRAGPRLPLLHDADRAAGPHSPRCSAAVPAVLQQVVLRRAVRLAVRPPAQALGLGLWRGGDAGDHRPASAPTAWPPPPGRPPSGPGACRPAIVYHYAFAMLIGVAALVTWYLFGRKGLSR